MRPGEAPVDGDIIVERWSKRLDTDERKRRRHDEHGSSASKSVQSFEDGDGPNHAHYFTDVVLNLINHDLAAEMKCELEPRSKLLDETVRILQNEAEDITTRRELEDKEIHDETERLTAEVTRIQSTISAFLNSYQPKDSSA